MKASLTNYRQSPRKVRLIAGAVKGKTLAAADTALSFMAKRGAEPMQKLIQSAAANAVVLGADASKLMVKNVEVNKGIVLKRMMPRAMGVGKPINKRTSHVTVTLAEVEPKAAKKSASKKVAK
jgi:large subunit ribosomal protein L22